MLADNHNMKWILLHLAIFGQCTLLLSGVLKAPNAAAGVVHLMIRKVGQPSKVDGCAHWQTYQT